VLLLVTQALAINRLAGLSYRLWNVPTDSETPGTRCADRRTGMRVQSLSARSPTRWACEYSRHPCECQRLTPPVTAGRDDPTGMRGLPDPVWGATSGSPITITLELTHSCFGHSQSNPTIATDERPSSSPSGRARSTNHGSARWIAPRVLAREGGRVEARIEFLRTTGEALAVFTGCDFRLLGSMSAHRTPLPVRAARRFHRPSTHREWGAGRCS